MASILNLVLPYDTDEGASYDDTNQIQELEEQKLSESSERMVDEL